jgi:hypothetical protein
LAARRAARVIAVGITAVACVAAIAAALAWLSRNIDKWGRCMSAIILPPPTDKS